HRGTRHRADGFSHAPRGPCLRANADAAARGWLCCKRQPMSAPLLDAHNHLHDARLLPWRAEFLTELPALGLPPAGVNGTREDDWPEVAALAKRLNWVLPSFGLHPWYVNERNDGWLEKLIHFLNAHPGAGIGEIGLDRWIEGHDPAVQAECFRAQLAI